MAFPFGYVAFTWTGPKQANPDVYVQMIGSAGSPLQLTTDASYEYNPGLVARRPLDRLPPASIGSEQG